MNESASVNGTWGENRVTVEPHMYICTNTHTYIHTFLLEENEYEDDSQI